MRLATYNVEWFNSLFDNRGNLLADGGWSGRQDVRRYEQVEALGIVFTALDADAVMVIEAPDHNSKRATVPALESFAAEMQLRARKAIIGFSNHTQQEIALLYDPDALTPTHDPQGAQSLSRGSPGAPRFDGTLLLEDDAGRAERVQFSKPPLELDITTAAGTHFRMIGVHAKSKAPHGAGSKDEATRLSIANRRKQLAQCLWLRRRVCEHLDARQPLVVLGDFNDGPGLDEYEKLFGHSGVEIVIGTAAKDSSRQLIEPHADLALNGPLAAHPSTARFYLAHENAYLDALLDYIMISPDLADRAPNWRIWHPFDDPAIYNVPELRDALLTASDHFPVTLDIAL